MAELADALDLGSSGRPWGFKSLYPHQKWSNRTLCLGRPFFMFSEKIKGLELGENLLCKFPLRVNSLVDCLSGGSREASPFIRTIKIKERKTPVLLFLPSFKDLNQGSIP